MGDIRDPHEAERLAHRAPEALESRRDFLQRTAAVAGLAAGLGLALDPDRVIAEAARVQRQVMLPSARNLPLDTIVVLMMENRSFDHYLGWLPGADGRQAGLSFTDSQGNTFETYDLGSNYQGCGFLDPDHSWTGGRTELDGGRMDGFLRAHSDTFAIGYYGERGLPFTPSVAKAFTAFDRFFCSVLTSTLPNREYMHSGQSYGMTDNTLPITPYELGFPDTTIFNSLTNAGVSNGYYFTDLPIAALWGLPGLARSSQVQQYYERAAAGTLPAVSFVDPGFIGEDQGTSSDEHPHGDVRVGQAFISDVVHAFIESPQWRRGALFIVYDEWGGFFDHVVPPRVPDLRSSPNLAQDFGQMGFRIPGVVVSPYARRGYVDHTIYGFESILKLIRYRYGLAPLTPRDLYANNIAHAFDFEHPNFDVPDLPSPPHIMAVPCATTDVAGLSGASVLAEKEPGAPGVDVVGAPVPVRAEQHDAATMLTSGYLERLGFKYRPATPATIFRHPSKLGLRS